MGDEEATYTIKYIDDDAAEDEDTVRLLPRRVAAEPFFVLVSMYHQLTPTPIKTCTSAAASGAVLPLLRNLKIAELGQSCRKG